MSNCRTCKYFDSKHSDCRRLISATSVAPNDRCENFKPKQETKQMKDYIVEKHEVKLDGEWHKVSPILNTDSKIMFPDPRPMPITPAPAAVSVSGAFAVSYLMIHKHDPFYRTSRAMRVVLNQDLDIIEKIKADYAEVELSPGYQYATVILD